jgi:CheY-like chemotaxis protein
MPEAIRAALISTDPAFRDLARDVVPGPDVGVVLAIELSVPFAEVGEQELKSLRDAEPDLIVLDLENDPELGIKFAHFVAESRPCRFLLVGPTLSQ